MLHIIIILVSFLLSFVLTFYFIRYAIDRGLLDAPNHRSSHLMATPRGGGVAIIISYLASLSVAFYGGYITDGLFSSMMIAGGVVGIIGYVDDKGHVAARWRLTVHLSSAGCALYLLGGMVSVFPLTVVGGGFLITNILALFFLVWFINLYNFMDGIDGLASIEAITFCIVMGAFCAYAEDMNSAIPFWILGAAVLGFSFWNFPPAKIFMGDAGSGFLGISLGILSVHAASVDIRYFWAACILLGVFIVDATYTLIYRYLHGAKVYEAHRSHAYQRAARRAGSHLPITLSVGAINLLWLAPIAALVVFGRLNGLIAIGLAYSPLLLIAIRFDAGKE